MSYAIKGDVAVGRDLTVTRRATGAIVKLPGFVASTAYQVGDVIAVSGSIWVRTVAGTSGAAFDLAEQANWSEVGANAAVTNTLVDTGGSIVSTVSGVSASITPAAGTIDPAKHLGFNTAGDMVVDTASVTENANGTMDVVLSGATGNAVRKLSEQTTLGAAPALDDLTVVRDTSAGTDEHRSATIAQVVAAGVQVVETPATGHVEITVTDATGTVTTSQAMRAANEMVPFGSAPEFTAQIPMYMASQSGHRTVTVQQLFAANKSYTATSSDVTVAAVPRGEAVVLVNASTGNKVVNLPAASASSIMTVRVGRYDSSANSLTIVPSGTDLIAGQATYTLAQAYDTVTLVADSGLGGWFIF